MDIPLPPLTMTTSSTEGLTLTEKCTETGGANPLVWAIVAAALVSAVVSGIVTWFMVSRLDGQRWIGWTGQIVALNGKDRRVLVPLFMKPEDLKELQEGK